MTMLLKLMRGMVAQRDSGPAQRLKKIALN